MLDCNDACPANSERWDGACGCDFSKPDPGVCGCEYWDLDQDQDGIIDCMDDCPQDKLKHKEGVCGCNQVDVDTDQDGVMDCVDECPLDPLKQVEGECGCGNLESSCYIGVDLTVLGGGVGVFVMVLVLCVVFLRRRKKKKQLGSDKREQGEYQSHNMYSPIAEASPGGYNSNFNKSFTSQSYRTPQQNLDVSYASSYAPSPLISSSMGRSMLPIPTTGQRTPARGARTPARGARTPTGARTPNTGTRSFNSGTRCPNTGARTPSEQLYYQNQAFSVSTPSMQSIAPSPGYTSPQKSFSMQNVHAAASQQGYTSPQVFTKAKNQAFASPDLDNQAFSSFKSPQDFPSFSSPQTFLNKPLYESTPQSSPFSTMSTKPVNEYIHRQQMGQNNNSFSAPPAQPSREASPALIPNTNVRRRQVNKN